MRLLLILAGSIYCATSYASNIEAIRENQAGLSHLEKGEFPQAEKRFLESLSVSPYNPVPRLNLGVTYEAAANPKSKDDPMREKALNEYESVLRSKNLPSELEFIAHFNAGNAAAGSSKVDEALSHYQAALALADNPERVEMVKRNIELLFMGGQGKGQGEGQGNEQDDGEGQGQGGADPKENPDSENNKQKKPQHFTQEEIKNILEELKAQESKIRALEYGNKAGQQNSPEKDW